MEGSVISDVLGKKEMKGSEQNVLDLSGKQLQSMSNLPKCPSVSELILDNNSITKIEKLDAFPKLCLLSMKGNHLMRMNGVNFGKSLVSVNLSNNGIVSMEGLCWLVHLEYLDLSKNNIKRIQNVSYCTTLKHMDLTENSIANISNLKSLVYLKVLLLHGNAITMLERAEDNLPEQIETLTLSGNGISDLNEVHHLSFLLNLKHFSIAHNPCVMTTSSLPEFDFRPFILSCLPSLVTLDDIIVTDNARQDAERLSQDENLSLFAFGHHLQVVLYLSKTFPTHRTNQLTDDQNGILDDFLQKRRTEIFGDEKSTKVKRKILAMNNHDVSSAEVRDIKATNTLESSSYSVLEFSERVRNENGSFSSHEDSETDSLHSESRFLPVYSPLRKSVGNDQRRFQICGETSHANNDADLPNMTDNITNESEDFPVMTEEEANKLINLAATILQSQIRGFLTRRKFDYRNFKKIHTAASKIQALWRGYYFRNYSNEFWHFKNELRVRRLQKYISVLCLMRHKSDKRHEVEKQRMLEIITLLYEKFSQLSEKVETLESFTNKGDKMERNNELGNGLKPSLDPVFFPHPRLTRNTELQEYFDDTPAIPLSEDTGHNIKGAVDLSEDIASTKYTKFDQTFQCCGDDFEDFGIVQEVTVGNRDALIEQEDRLCDDKLYKVEDDRKDDKIMDDDCHWSKEVSEDSTETGDEINIQEDTDSHGCKISKFSHDELSTDITDLTENDTITSEVFTTSNVCELLKTIENDKKNGMMKMLPSTEEGCVDPETTEDLRSDEVITWGLSMGATFEYKQVDVDPERQFDDPKPHTSNVENDQKLEANVIAEDITKRDMRSVETVAVGGNDDFQQTSNCSSDENDVGIPVNTENKMAGSVVEHEGDLVITQHEGKDGKNHDNVSFESFVGKEEGDVQTNIEEENYQDKTGYNIEQDFAPDAGFVNESTQRTRQAELSSRDQEVMEKLEITMHENTAGDAINDSLEQIELSDGVGTISTVESKDCVMAENDFQNIKNSSQSFNELQDNDTETSQLKIIRMDDDAVNESHKNNKESGFNSNSQEAETESKKVEEKETSPRLRERASSLLSALKDEITGVSSKEDQPENSCQSVSQLSGCYVHDMKDAEPGLSNEFFHASEKK